MAQQQQSKSSASIMSDGIGALAGGIGAIVGSNNAPSYEQQFLGGSESAQNARYGRDDRTIEAANLYTQELLKQQANPNFKSIGDTASTGYTRAAGIGDTVLAAAAKDNPYIGRTAQDKLLADQLVREAATRNMAQAQSIGGAAGARAAAGANAGAAVEAARAQQLAQQQERAQMAQATNQSLAARAGAVQGFEQSRGGLGIGAGTAANAFDLQRGALANQQTATFVQNQQAMDAQAAKNYNDMYAAQTAAAAARGGGISSIIGGVGNLGLGYATGGMSMLGGGGGQQQQQAPG